MTIYHNKTQYDRDTLAEIAALTDSQLTHIWFALHTDSPHGAFVREAINCEFDQRRPADEE